MHTMQRQNLPTRIVLGATLAAALVLAACQAAAPAEPLAVAPVEQPQEIAQPETDAAAPTDEVEVAESEPEIQILPGQYATDPATVSLASGGPQLVEFFAFWCPTCKRMAPDVHALQVKYDGQIDFVYLDIDDPATTEFKQQLGYSYQPHTFLLDGDGNVVGQWIGLTSYGTLDTALSDISG